MSVVVGDGGVGLQCNGCGALLPAHWWGPDVQVVTCRAEVLGGWTSFGDTDFCGRCSERGVLPETPALAGMYVLTEEGRRVRMRRAASGQPGLRAALPAVADVDDPD